MDTSAAQKYCYKYKAFFFVRSFKMNVETLNYLYFKLGIPLLVLGPISFSFTVYQLKLTDTMNLYLKQVNSAII